MPFLVVAKEISLEDVRISLSKLSDRFVEHPATVIVVTNMHYSEAPWLRPKNIDLAAALNWQNVELDGESSHQYGEQLRDLNKTSNMGVGGLKVFLVIGSILVAIWTFMKITD